MEASIKEPNIKNFVRLLQCASRFGDDLNMHANKDMWELAVTNSSKSAFCLFKLKKSFFCRYKAMGETAVDRRKGVKCQLLVKSLLAVLGKHSSVSNVERIDLTITDPDQALRAKRRRKSTTDTASGRDEEDYEEGHSEEEPEARGIEAKLIMKILCRHGVTKKHSLHLGTSDFLRADVDPNSTPSFMSITARALRDMLDHFSVISSSTGPSNNIARGENQLGWMFGNQEVRVKSWEGSNSLLSTEIKVDPGEFDEYWVEGERVDLTIPMKEFRAALTLAEQLNIKLNIAFSEPGQPVTLTSDPNEADDHPYDIFCAIATTNCDAFSDVQIERKPRITTSSSAVHPSNGTTSQNRSRTESEAPSNKRKRSTLSMSANAPAPQNGSAVVIRVQDPPADESEPLFLPHSQENGSQGDKEQADESVPFPRLTQKVVMSQQEIMDLSGMGDLDPDDLLDDLDAMEREEELEEQEMMRMSQRNEESLIRGQGGMVMDETIPLPEEVEGQLSGVFRLADGIFGPGPRSQVGGEEIAKEEEEEEVAAEKTDEHGEDENKENMAREAAAEVIEEDELDEEVEFTPTQSAGGRSARQDGRTFTTLFDD